MNELFKLFVSLSVSGSIIALVLFALKPLIKDTLSKAWQYYVWLIVIIRLLLPFSIQANVVGRFFSEADRIITTQTAVSEPMPEHPAALHTLDSQMQRISHSETLRQEKTIHVWNEVKNIGWLIWLGVAILLFVRKVTSYRSFVRYIKAGMSDVSDHETLGIFQAACRDVGLKKPIQVYTNPLVASAMLVGVVNPFVVVPSIGVRTKELRHIFIHELMHCKRLDVFYKWAMQIAVCLHWYNPVMYLINREINTSCELACDEAVLGVLDDQDRRQYGDTLLSSLKFGGAYNDAIVSITLSEDAKRLKERLEAVMKFRKKTSATTVFSTGLTICIISVAMVTGAYASAANTPAIVSTTPLHAPEEAKETLDGSNPFLRDAYISYEGQGASHLVVEFPAWYTKDLWDVTFIWGDYAAIPVGYDSLDENNRIRLGVGHDTHYALKITLPDNEVLVIDLRELERHLTVNPPANKIHAPAQNQPPKPDGAIYTTPEEADERGFAIIDSSGTWGSEVDRLLPYMTQGAVDKIVAIYLERHLFPGITTAEGIERVSQTLQAAFAYMSEDARKGAERRIAAYAQLQPFSNLATTRAIIESHNYLMEGGVAAYNFQYGNPFPAKKGDRVTISLADDLSGWQLHADAITLKIVIGGNDGTTQEIILSNTEREKSIDIKENANHHITIRNPNNQLVNYRLVLSIQSEWDE